MEAFSRLLPRVSKSKARAITLQAQSPFNEHIRRAERHVPFDVGALSSIVCKPVSRSTTELASIDKLAEGGFNLNHVLELSFKDDYSVLARIPFKSTVPKHYAVASEAATLDLLRSYGIPASRVLTYSSGPSNPVGTEYPVLEKLDGRPLSDQWFTIDNKTRVKIMKQVVQVESRLMSARFPASGSLKHDLDDIVVGPTAQHEWWYKERALLGIIHGTDYRSAFEAPAIREIEFCKQFGRPRPHIELYLRELYPFQMLSPSPHVRLLLDYLRLSAHLELAQDHPFSRPTLRHPDISPNNILVNASNDISGIIDWQHAAILPLCLCAGIPEYFQNWGDPISETLAEPDVELPENSQDLSHYEQENTLETRRRRLYMYKVAYTTDAEEEKMQELSEMRDVVGTDAQGWVPDDEHLERAKSVIQKIKDGLLQELKTDLERTAIVRHFPFDDHDED
ncbi:kinase-like protein [Aspergillus undulatus]|uniref:kinase-like protein n=1 Tax=Aspergillus undulatus TaxID=1810928 RepID=UPI003CCD3F04